MMPKVRIREPAWPESPPPIRKTRIRESEPTADIDPILTALAGGVPTHTLRKIFRLDYETTRERVRPLKPIRVGRGGARLYDLAAAAQYLVDPKIDVAAYLTTLRPADLPKRLQAAWWEAKLKRQKWEKNAGDLWPTSRVLEALSEAFKSIRVESQLWIDELETLELTPAIREALAGCVDLLLANLYKRLVEDAKKSLTFSQLADIDEGAEDEEV